MCLDNKGLAVLSDDNSSNARVFSIKQKLLRSNLGQDVDVDFSVKEAGCCRSLAVLYCGHILHRTVLLTFIHVIS